MGDKIGSGEPASLRGRSIPAYSVDPRVLKLITDPKHPLYDERVHAPIDEAMVESIMHHGVAEAIVVRKNGQDLEVVDGRQRTKNAVEANKRRKAQGAFMLRVPIMLRSGEDKDVLGLAVTLNEIRRPDEALIKAAKARRMSHLGATIADIARDFGVVPETIENWLKLDELAPDVKRLVAAGTLKYTVAMRLVRLPRAEQMAKAKELLSAGATNANAVRAVVGGKLERVRPPAKQKLRRVADAFLKQKEFLRDEATSDAYAFIEWCLGRVSTDELLDLLSAKAGAISDAVKMGLGLERQKA